MQTVKGVKVRCIKLLKNKVYKFARYIIKIIDEKSTYQQTANHICLNTKSLSGKYITS